MITLRGVSYLEDLPDNHDGYNFTSTLPSFRYGERDEAFDQLSHQFQNRDGYEAYIYQVEILFVPNEGGCEARERKVNINGYTWISPESDHDNCFFACLDISDQRAEELRKKYGVEGSLSPSAALNMIQELNLVGTVCIFVRDLKTWVPAAPKEMSPTCLLLHGGHYYYYCGVDEKMWREKFCTRCDQTYVRSHRCKGLAGNFCGRCCTYHKPTEKCPPELRYLLPKKRKNIALNKKKEGGEKAQENRFIHERYVIHYDLETYVKKKSKEHTPYAVGFTFRGQYQVYTGKACMERFMTWLGGVLHQEPKETFYLNAFNGANFDHHFVIQELLRRKKKYSEPMISQGSIVGGGFRNLRFFDLCKHTQGSLAKNLEAYRCKTLKGDFDHSKVTGGWDHMTNEQRADLLKYLEADVKGLEQLFNIIAENVDEEFDELLVDYISSSQMTYSIWNKACRWSKDIYVPLYHEEKVIRQTVYGGRVYPSKKSYTSPQFEDFREGKIGYEEVSEYAVDMDVVSLYPAAMAQFKYPIGGPSKLTARKRKQWNDLYAQGRRSPFMGVAHVRATPPDNLAHPILPHRDKGLKWTLEPVVGYYNTVDIDNAIQWGYRIEITQQGGWYWKRAAHIFTEYIEDIFAMKNKYANSDTDKPKYLLAKILMNGLYGKMIQRPVYKQQRMCKTNADIHNFFSTHEIVEHVDFTSQIYVAGPPRNMKEFGDKISKPTQLGSFVLAYSRKIMLNYMSLMNPCFRSEDLARQAELDFCYTDTDSIQVRYRPEMQAIMREGLGGINHDLPGDGKILNAVWIAPKLYMLIFCRKDQPGLHYHFKAKGVQTSALHEEVFRWMHEGKAVEVCRDFALKKTHVNKVSPFSIEHLEWHDTRRFLNMKVWSGRCMLGNNSVPWGHRLAQDAHH